MFTTVALGSDFRPTGYSRRATTEYYNDLLKPGTSFFIPCSDREERINIQSKIQSAAKARKLKAQILIGIQAQGYGVAVTIV